MKLLAPIGAKARAQSAYVLQLAALSWGLLREGVRPSTWRRTVRAGFMNILTRVIVGALGTVALTAVVIGLGLVFEAIYWLRTAGQEGQIGRVLVVVLFRELTPLLVGIILLGRGGMATIAELGSLKAEGEIGVLRAEGIDIFQYLVLPRCTAFALASFTLGVIFVSVSLVSGFVTGSLAGVVNTSIFGFIDTVLRATDIVDLAIFPAKLLLIGLVVSLACCLTGLSARPVDTGSTILPRGFTRGILGILAVTLALGALA